VNEIHLTVAQCYSAWVKCNRCGEFKFLHKFYSHDWEGEGKAPRPTATDSDKNLLWDGLNIQKKE